jgi:DNA repair exonuclease SbcCD nuclease subunit
MLILGDPHVRPDNIQESEKLLSFVESEALNRKEKTVVILGDLFHTHRVIRMEVQNFWIKWAKRLGQNFSVIAIVGNHDQPGDDQNEDRMSALDVLRNIPGFIVVDSPKIIEGITYLPHTASAEKFSHWVSEANSKILVCHQTFDGSQYENGFYAKDGLPLTLVEKFDLVIGGHIHKPQEYANVWLPGTARWDSISDANQNKGIWVFDTTSYAKTFISTSKVCSPIISLEIKEGEEIPDFEDSLKTHVKLIGSSAWIAKVSKALKGKVRISSKPTDSRASQENKELSTLEQYSKNFKFLGSITAEEVMRYVESL